MNNQTIQEIEKGVILPDKIISNKIQTKKQQSRSAEYKKRKFIKLYIDSGNAVQSYKNTFRCSLSTANGLASNYLKKIDIEDLMEQSGITDQALINGLKTGLQADKPYGKEGFIHPDYATRHTYIETGLKLKKRLNPTNKDTNNQMVGLNIIINK